jgi:hypothetical protein
MTTESASMCWQRSDTFGRMAQRPCRSSGASLGGWTAADASVEAKPGEIDRLVLLAHSPIVKPEQIKGRKLFIVCRDDTNDAGLRLPRIREQYEKAPDPKELVILEGSAHAQFIFATDQGERLMAEILRFLSAL